MGNMIGNISVVLIILMMVCLFIISMREKRNAQKTDAHRNSDNDMLKVEKQKCLIPVKVQAYERLLLYVERIQFPILVKRVFYPSIPKDDFQFSLLQNVQDEYEHNLAQRLYVSEDTWHLVDLAKEEVLQNINAVFNDNPDADVAMIARKLVSLSNPMVEKAVMNIKFEFDSL